MRKKRQSGAALLIECLMVCCVLLILAAMSVPNIQQMQRNAAQTAAISRVHQLASLVVALQTCNALTLGAACTNMNLEIPAANTPTAPDTNGYVYEYVTVPQGTQGSYTPPTGITCILEFGPFAIAADSNYAQPHCSTYGSLGELTQVPTVGPTSIPTGTPPFLNLGQCSYSGTGTYYPSATGNEFVGMHCAYQTPPSWSVTATPVTGSLINNGVSVNASMIGVFTCTPKVGAAYAC